MLSRTDLEIYNNGLTYAKDCLISIYGGVENAPKFSKKSEISLGGTYPVKKTFKYNVENVFNHSYKELLVVIVAGMTKFYVQSNLNLTLIKEFANGFSATAVKNLSVTQVENSVVVCSKDTKPTMYRIKDESLPSTTAINEVAFWDSIKDGALKTISQEYKVNVPNPNIGQWRKTDGKTAEPDGYIPAEGYYVRIEGDIYTREFLDKIVGGNLELFGNTFKVAGYTIDVNAPVAILHNMTQPILSNYFSQIKGETQFVISTSPNIRNGEYTLSFDLSHIDVENVYHEVGTETITTQYYVDVYIDGVHREVLTTTTKKTNHGATSNFSRTYQLPSGVHTISLKKRMTRKSSWGIETGYKCDSYEDNKLTALNLTLNYDNIDFGGESGGDVGEIREVPSAFFKGYTTLILVPLDMSGLEPPTLKEKVDANGNYIYILDSEGKETSKIAREINWERVNIKQITFYEDIFKNGGYPGVCTYYQGRLVFANLTKYPDFIAFSETYNYFKYQGLVTNDNSGFTQVIPSSTRANIIDLITSNSLLILTDQGIYSTQINGTVTPLNSFLTEQPLPKNSVTKGMWINLNSFIYYVDYYNEKIINIQPNQQATFYTYKDINVFNREIIAGSIKGIVPSSYNGEDFILVNKGTEVALCKVNQNENVFAWSRLSTSFSDNLTSMMIDGDTVLIDVGNNTLYMAKFSDTEFRNTMEIELYPVIADERQIDIPILFKEGWKISDVKLNVIGKGEYNVNGVKVVNLFDGLQTLHFNNIICDKARTLKIGYNGNNKVYISGIIYAITFDAEVL